jgi:hypothetical protein
MKNLKLFVVLGIVVGAISFAWVGLVNAHSFRTGTNVSTGQTEVINETLFVSGRTIDISSEVYGDVFCAGQTISVSGIIHGDVICAGQTVNVSGKVDGDIRLAGQSVTVGAEVGGNATIASQTFNLESKGKINGDLSVGSSDTTINGSIGRNLAVASENLIISNSVEGNVQATVTNFTLSTNSNVNGNIEYTSKNEVNREQGSEVAGEVTRNQPSQPSTKSKTGAVFGFSIAWFIYWFLAMLLTAMVLVLLFPRMFQVVTNRAMPTPWKALLTGFLASLALPLVIFILLITIIGIPLAFIVMFTWLLVLLLSGPLFGYYLGRLILRESRKPLLIMLVGASILLVLYFLPIIGFIALIAATWIGAGMLLLEVFGRTPKPSYEVEARK